MNPKLIAYGGSILAILVGLWFFANHFENQGYQKRVAEEQVKQNEDLQTAALATQKLQSQLNEAQRELTISKQKLAAISASNINLSNSLRDSITQYNRNLPNDSREALINRIDTLGTVFGECTARYAEVAGKADAYTAELKMMQEAWPSN